MIARFVCISLCLLAFCAKGQITFPVEPDTVSSIIVPNVFTPNADSINDIFRPQMTGIVSLEAAVYNRYGNLIYEWNRINGFWDGRTTSGEPVSDGQYFYVIHARGVDQKEYKLSGFISLLSGGYYH